MADAGETDIDVQTGETVNTSTGERYTETNQPSGNDGEDHHDEGPNRQQGSNEFLDKDGDGILDAIDWHDGRDADGDGVANSDDFDQDGNGIPDVIQHPGTTPLDPAFGRDLGGDENQIDASNPNVNARPERVNGQ